MDPSRPSALSPHSSPSLVQQLLPMLAMQTFGRKIAVGGDGKDGGGGGGGGLKQLLLFDIASKALPVAAGFLVNAFHARMKARSSRLYEMMRNGDGHLSKKGSVVLERDLDARPSASDDMFDAILAHASDLPQTRFVRRLESGVFTVETNDDISLGGAVFFRRVAVGGGSGVGAGAGEKRITIEVFSFEKTIVQLRDFLNDVEEKYKTLRNNQLGRHIYYFDEIPQKRSSSASANANPHLVFSKFQLNTNKDLTNVFGKPMRNVVKRIEFFVKNRAWYEAKGVPYTLGLLLHGPAGCGKTSLAKALARSTNRHIVNVRLSKATTVTQLHNLFYSGRMVVANGMGGSPNDHSGSVFNIPNDKVILMLEDVDCLTDIVLDRRAKAKARARRDAASAAGLGPDAAGGTLFMLPHVGGLIDRIAKLGVPTSVEEQQRLLEAVGSLQMMHRNARAMKEKEDADAKAREATGEEITLAALLNVLDGILETPGRIIIMTSNHPERLDRALVRPGRIDAIVHFTKCSSVDIKEMVESLCDVVLEEGALAGVPEFAWTPAEVTQLIFENIESVGAIVAKLKCPPSQVDDEDDDDVDEACAPSVCEVNVNGVVETVSAAAAATATATATSTTPNVDSEKHRPDLDGVFMKDSTLPAPFEEASSFLEMGTF